MPGIEKLHLEDALEDSPQTRRLLGVFEKDAMILKKYTTTLFNSCQRILNAQNELCSATQALSQHLSAYEKQDFPLESDDSILSSTLKQFSSYLDDVSSLQQVLATQLADGMMYPLTKFLHADMEEILTMFEMFQIASVEHEQALTKFTKLPKKKDNERQRLDANEELYVMRKKFHQTALHYYSALNSLQYKRKCFLLEPIVGYLHAHRAFFQMGGDAICKSEIDEFLSNISASVQGVQQEMNEDTQKAVELMDSVEHQSLHLYHAEPMQDMPFIPPNTNLVQKSGYLYLRSRQALIASKWERLYFFTQGGNLMMQSKDEVAGGLLMDLSEEGASVEPTDSDDRRFVFQLASGLSKKSVILQAVNERERDEWIATLRNIIKDAALSRSKQTRKERSASVGSHRSQSSNSAEAGSLQGSIDSSAEGAKLASSPATSPARPHPHFLLDTPIQFDMISPTKEVTPVVADGPPKRINPFDESSVDVMHETAGENAAFSQPFTVRFCGSMEVNSDRGEGLVLATIRQIMAARAIHNVFKMTESVLLVTNECLRLLEPSTHNIRIEFALQDIAFWSPHKDNKRLFGFITRSRSDGPASYACHVFECDKSGDEICQAISTATQMAYQAYMEKRASEKKKTKEKSLLLANIDQLEDRKGDRVNSFLEAGEEVVLGDDSEVSPPLSPDGKYVLLDQSDPHFKAPDVSKPPSSDIEGKDVRQVEGAERESEA
ncbi:DCC-interacting protein 13-alpha-like isoform X1 [Liolophura sinensis]|uniref:DCC-interacting protein 13-alpha-like isoform X1 n=1 Tax=Liolophura sinensis TaxID=3198878 RepID=UPI0031592EDB